MNVSSGRPAVVAAALLALPLTACSADEPAGFCESFASLESLNGELSTFGADDPEGAGAKLDEVSVALEGIEAPADVADSFAVYSDALGTYTDAASQALTDLENVDQESLAAATQAMTSEELGAARADLATWTGEHCS